MAKPSPKDYAAIALAYAEGVIREEIPACRWVKLACQRHIDDLKRAEGKRFLYRFDADKATRACLFVEQMPYTKGKWAQIPGNKMRIEPWQVFVICSLFGWVHKQTGFRRFRKAYICVPRKNGKSALVAAIGLYMLCADGEQGAEVYCGATSEKQAFEVFTPAKVMAEKTPALAQAFGVEVYKSNISIPGKGCKFEPVIGKPGDGASPSCAIADEYHEHDDDSLVSTMQTGMVAREQPLLIMPTTAGVNLAGPCYAQQLDVQKMLEGALSDDSLFGIIYTIDEGDDWTTEAALIKANPNWGVSVNAEIVLAEQKQAIQLSRKQNAFKTKHLNIWCGAYTAYFNAERWRELGDESLRIEDFQGCRCWGAMDLASKCDIACIVIVFERLEDDGEKHYYFFAKHYLPEERVSDSDTPNFQKYSEWAETGALVVTDGGATDMDTLEVDAIAWATEYTAQAWCYDPFSATQMAQHIAAEGVTTIEIPQNVRHLSEPMKWLEALILTGRAHHNGDPVLFWMIANVTAREDKNENVFPVKDRPENKIDGAVCCIMALSRAMVDEEPGGSYYDSNPLEFI